MVELFQTTPQNITLHLKNIYQEEELAEEATCKDFLQVQTKGTRKVQRSRRFYNLDAIKKQKSRAELTLCIKNLRSQFLISN